MRFGSIQSEPWVDTVLIYIYHRIQAHGAADHENNTGGFRAENTPRWNKNRCRKDRLVPIHPRILPLIQERMRNNDAYLFHIDGYEIFVLSLPQALERGYEQNRRAKKHLTRHGIHLRQLLDNANGNRKCIDLLMGHKSPDIGNRTYNHKTLEQLRATILLLP